jgi:hypothetical protein
MSQRVFLHVGLPKSGTSYVQKLLAANKPRLKRDADLLFPGARWHKQVLAVRDVRDMGRRRAARGQWAQLVKEIAAWPGDSVISMEWLCAADDAHIRRIVEDLAPATIEVVFTVRDVARTLPAAWQEFMQNRYTWSWDEFLEAVTSAEPLDSEPGRVFWSQQDVPGLVGRWSSVVSPDHTHVVTLPHPGAAPGVLWQRLAQVFGINSQGYVVDGLGGNESLGLESTELMRRLNPLTREAGINRTSYHQIFKHTLAKGVLAERRSLESRLALPVAHHEWATATANRQIESLRASGVHVVGDLADLEPVFPTGEQPANLSDGQLLETSLVGLVALASRAEAAERERMKVETRNLRLERRLARSQRRLVRAEQRVSSLSARVSQFETAPLRSGLRLRARSLRSK